jgi:hypothetical protein
MQTTVFGPGNISFRYKMSSVSSDSLTFYIGAGIEGRKQGLDARRPSSIASRRNSNVPHAPPGPPLSQKPREN